MLERGEQGIGTSLVFESAYSVILACANGFLREEEVFSKMNKR